MEIVRHDGKSLKEAVPHVRGEVVKQFMRRAAAKGFLMDPYEAYWTLCSREIQYEREHPGCELLPGTPRRASW